MISICFVCHGNICRSPMAEFIMKQLVKEAGREAEFRIESRATHTDEIWNGAGSPIYPPAQRELRRNGVLFDENKRAQLLTKNDAARFDWFIGMDAENRRWMPRILGSAAEGRIRLLLGETEVSDPWYSGNFTRTYEDILRGCRALLSSLAE